MKIDRSHKRDIIAANESHLRCYGTVKLNAVHDTYKAPILLYISPDLKDEVILSWHGMIALGMLPATFPTLPKSGPIQINTLSLNNNTANYKHTASQASEPLLSAANQPFQTMSVNLFQYAGKDYLIMADHYTGWPFVACIEKTGTNTDNFERTGTNTDNFGKTGTKGITDHMLYCFQNYTGIPQHMRSDGGPQFHTDIDKFCKSLNIIHETSSPFHSPSNGHADATITTMQHLLMKYNANWSDFQSALLEWKQIPRSDGLSPAQWLFNRRQRTQTAAHPSAFSKLSDDDLHSHEIRREEIKDSAKNHFNQTSKSLPVLQVDDDVLIQNHRTMRWDLHGKILDVRDDGRSYLLNLNGSQTFRNRQFLKPLLKSSFSNHDRSTTCYQGPSSRKTTRFKKRIQFQMP